MKVISLNAWGGDLGKEVILPFFEKYRDTTDIFCLQEIWDEGAEELLGEIAGGKPLAFIYAELLKDISAVLPNHKMFFHPHYKNYFGLASFVQKDVFIEEVGDIFVHLHKYHIPEGDCGNHARNIQYISFKTEAGTKTVLNFHGLWNGKGKGDCQERIVQSDNAVSFLKTLEHPYVLVGDFNLRPDTQSLKKFEALGLRNLISEYGITDTRTSHYKKPERFADYAFVSDGIKVIDFKVLPDEVSDHAPLYIEFE